jgi:hypothetical protein
MKLTAKAGLVLASCTLASMGALAPAQAQSWTYTLDSFNDGQQGSSPTGPIVGANSAFEMYGLALKQTADEVFIAINSNLDLAGYSSGRATDGNIGYGDLFLNFTGSSKFADAEGDSNLFGIRFAGTNDSGVAETGVYSNVTSKDVTADNAGFESLNQYKSQIDARGGSPSFADMDWTGSTADGEYTNYFGPTDQKRQFATSIDSGTKVGDVTSLTPTELSTLSFGGFGAVGNHTFGFKFDRSLLPEDGGDFVAHLVAECVNDGLVMLGSLNPVTRIEEPDPSQEAPEPALLTGFVLLGGLGLMKRRAQQKSEMA